MAEETDGIEEAIEGQIRVAVTAAAQTGERLARSREDARRRAAQRSEQEARELRTRIDAEQRAARAELGNVYRSDWWERADAEQVGHAYQTARAWSADDPEAVRAEQRMRDELRTRYGVDVDNTQADPAAVRAAVDRAQNDRTTATAEQATSTTEAAEAAQLARLADQQDERAEQARQAAEFEPDPEERDRAAVEVEQREAVADQARDDAGAMYDTAERRADTAADLESKGIDHEVVATRMRADVSQARPATEAVKSTGRSRSPKARETRGRAAQIQRSGLDR